MTIPSRQHAPPPRHGKGARVLAALVWALAGWLAAPPTPAQAADDSLQKSKEMRKQFPFQANCNGNTQEMVACLWERRNREDGVLGSLLGVAKKGEGGSIHPILWLRCENGMNRELLRLLKQPLFPKAGS